MTREEAHALLDAVMDTNSTQDRYDVDVTFQNNYDGTPMATVFIHDNRLDAVVLKMQHRTNVVKSFIVSDYSESVWDAVKAIAKYRGEKA